jgi:hypothetical protein
LRQVKKFYGLSIFNAERKKNFNTLAAGLLPLRWTSFESIVIASLSQRQRTALHKTSAVHVNKISPLSYPLEREKSNISCVGLGVAIKGRRKN